MQLVGIFSGGYSLGNVTPIDPVMGMQVWGLTVKVQTVIDMTFGGVK